MVIRIIAGGTITFFAMIGTSGSPKVKDFVTHERSFVVPENLPHFNFVIIINNQLICISFNKSFTFPYSVSFTDQR